MFVPHSRPTLGAGERRAVSRAIASGWLAGGPETAALERAFAVRLGAAGAKLTSSGTAALYVALRALGLKKGDRVAAPAYSCAAIHYAIRSTGAETLPVDVSPEDGNLDPAALAHVLDPTVKAVVVTHLFGRVMDLEPILAFGVPVIEDLSHAIGATDAGRLGAFSATSLYATKMITGGQGGIVTARAARHAAAAADWLDCDDRDDPVIRFNLRGDEMTAALARVQLARLDTFIAKRRRIARRFDAAFADLPVLLPPRETSSTARARGDREGTSSPSRGGDHVHYRYVLKTDRSAERLREQARRSGLGCERPVHAGLGALLGRPDPPSTRAWLASALSIPIYPTLTASEIERMIEGVRALFGPGRRTRRSSGR